MSLSIQDFEKNVVKVHIQLSQIYEYSMKICVKRKLIFKPCEIKEYSSHDRSVL